MSQLPSILSRLYENAGSGFCHPCVSISVGVGVDVGIILFSFMAEGFFYVMGKVLSGKLSCMLRGFVMFGIKSKIPTRILIDEDIHETLPQSIQT